MSYEGLERFFIEKYESMERERDALRERVLQLEGDLAGAEFGITDLRRKFKAVRGTVCAASTLKGCMLDKGVTCDQMREYIALTDEELFAKFRNKSVSYYTVLKFERRTFQYTLMVKESRDEWVAFTDGGAGDQLYCVPDEDDDDLIGDDWFPAEREDEMVEALCALLRERMGEAVERWEKENEDA